MDSHSQGTLIRASIKELKSMYCCDNYSEYGTMHTWGFVSLKPTVVERDTEKVLDYSELRKNTMYSIFNHVILLHYAVPGIRSCRSMPGGIAAAI